MNANRNDALPEGSTRSSRAIGMPFRRTSVLRSGSKPGCFVPAPSEMQRAADCQGDRCDPLSKRGINYSGKNAFTLVELLTVTAVLGVLAGLAFPAFASAWNRTRSVQCLNHLRQLGLGLKFYADADSEGRLPSTANDSGLPPIAGRILDSWVVSLTNQLPGWHELRICPADAARKQRRGDQSSSYLLNTCLDQVLGPDGGPLMTPTDCPRMDRLNAPAETFLTFEASLAGYQAGEDRVHPEIWLLGWEHVLADIEPNRHGRGANYLFGDGHVQSWPAFELRQRIERGDNFALPPQ